MCSLFSEGFKKLYKTVNMKQNSAIMGYFIGDQTMEITAQKLNNSLKHKKKFRKFSWD